MEEIGVNDKVTFSIAVGLGVVSLGASLILGVKLTLLIPQYAAVLSSVMLLKQRSNSLKCKTLRESHL
ncbi:MAG TPA: hypothetical protein VGN87_03875 [Paenibacillus sp.]|jgi:hypothetical protein